MDVLKILTRSIKQTRKPAENTQSSNLPSAGTASNPQLYNDPVPEPRGTKRKLVDRQSEQLSTNETGEDLNFFAPKVEKRKPSEKAKTQPELPTNNAAPQLLEQDECRRVLLSHRLKITLFPLKDTVTTGDKATKKKKKQKEPPSVKKKGEYKQIYPQPLTHFKDLRTTYGISRRLAENIASQGYHLPTEIQLGTLPMQLRPDLALHESTDDVNSLKDKTNLDILAIAPTGSGKTLAFLIPIIESMIQRRREKENDEHSLEAIVVAPTKELANQIVNEGRKLALGTGIRVVGMKKGMRIVENGDENDLDKPDEDEDEVEDQENEDESGSETNGSSKKKPRQPLTKADVIVTTPLVFLHALSGAIEGKRAPLPTVRHLILDEADVLLDALFRDQTLGIWESCINPHLHVTLWSATIGSNIEALASDTIVARRKRLELEISAPILRVVVGLKDSAIPNITHRLVYAASETGKLIGLRQLLHPAAPSRDSTQSLRPPFLVFTQTIPRAIALHSELLYDIPAEAGGSSRIAVLHSDLSETARDRVMTRFRNGEVWVLITTDILSRGVDFRGINGVVNYDVPNSAAAYIHRVGRTGRAGRDGGVAVTFYTKEDIPYVKNVANIIAVSEKQAGKAPSESGIQQWLLDALPTPSKADKKKLKLHGVEARRSVSGKDGKGSRMRISTKSGYERRLENNRRGAVVASKKRVQEMQDKRDLPNDEDSEWGGIDD